MGLDIGPEAIEEFKKVILNAKTILWNGPMGVFEMPTFAQGTKSIALAVAQATQSGAFSLVGGGDSVAAINQLDLQDQVSYVSTGGGAMLELLEGKELPGVKALQV
jgi:phosphoglycerate kinase